MQENYQPHMLCGMVVAAALAGLAALWTGLSPAPVPAAHVRVTNVRADSRAFTPAEAKPTKRNVGGAADNLPALHGQFGVKIRIIPDNPVPTYASVAKPKVHVTEELAAVPDLNISVSDLTEGEPGPYVPADAEYTFDPLPPETTAVEPDVVPCSVLVAVPPEYPWVARRDKKEGRAGIIVCIDESGRVSLFSEEIAKQFQAEQRAVEKMAFKVDGQKRFFNYVVVNEEPTGWFFAKKVAEKLGDWVFQPSTVNGHPVPSLLAIGHAFCLTKDCTYEYETLQNYKHYHAVASR